MDIEEYFGCRASSNPADTKRALRRDVWSEDDNHIAEALYRHYRRHTLPLMERPTNEPPDSANTESVLIPKLLHFVWLGADPIPTYNMGGVVDSSHYRGLWNAFIQSWSEHHPASSGWSIKVWTDESVVQLRNSDQPLTNQAAFDYAMTIKNYGMASDILRLDILHKFGGVYVDVDYMCLGSVETFHQMFNFYCGCSNTGCVEVNNGLMGCVSSHPLVRIMMEDIREWFDRSGLGERNSQITSAKKGDENLLSMSLLASFLDESSVLALQNASDIEQRPSTTDILRHTGPGLLTRSLYNALVNVTHRHIVVYLAIGRAR